MEVTIGQVILLILQFSWWVFTVCTLVGAERCRRELRQAGLNGPRGRYANRMVRHEAFRLVKHTLVLGLIFIAAFDIPHLLQWRSAGISAIGFLIGTNSLLDLLDRRAGLRGYLRGKKSEPVVM